MGDLKIIISTLTNEIPPKVLELINPLLTFMKKYAEDYRYASFVEFSFALDKFLTERKAAKIVTARYEDKKIIFYAAKNGMEGGQHIFTITRLCITVYS